MNLEEKKFVVVLYVQQHQRNYYDKSGNKLKFTHKMYVNYRTVILDQKKPSNITVRNIAYSQIYQMGE